MKGKHFATSLLAGFRNAKSKKPLESHLARTARLDYSLLQRLQPTASSHAAQASYRSVTACIY